MAKRYQVELSQEPERFLEKAKKASAKDGISFTGDASMGTFAVLGVKGNYKIENKTALINITEKPFLIPWGVVEVMMRDFFA